MRRRDFLTLVGGATAWPLAARAQQPALPVIGFLRVSSLAGSIHLVAAFRRGLKEASFIEGQNVVVEYRWAEGQNDGLNAIERWSPRSSTPSEKLRSSSKAGGATPSLDHRCRRQDCLYRAGQSSESPPNSTIQESS